MNPVSGKCLACLETWPGPGDYHPKCSRKFFGKAEAPVLEYGLEDMERLAGDVIRTHSAVPGVQAKLSWGRYILKPPAKRYPELPEVEHATMHLADALGLRTVPHAMIRLKSGELAYITKRIDRDKAGKIAMEDLCQLTGRLTEDKYRGSLEQVGKAIRAFSDQPGLDAVNFFELTLFCFLTGNADMHLKNFSLWRPGVMGMQLSPAYDLVATRLLLPEDSEETALALNGKKKNLRRKDFDALASTLQLPEKARDSVYAKLARSRKEWEPSLEKGFLSDALKRAYLQLMHARAGILDLGST